MPPTAKKYRTDIPKSSSDVSDKESKGSPEKVKVVSGQLERSLTKKRKTRKGPFKSNRGVVFVKNLPHGFFEEQLQKYFGQFGKVTRVRLARSLRTGGSKGFAFVEFAVPEVAEIAAETMNNYLMFRKIVKAAYIPPDQQKFNYFKTSLRKIQNKRGKDVYVSAVTKRVAKKVAEMNNWSAENYAKRMKKTQGKLRALKRDLSHMGYDVDSVVPKMPTSSGAVEEKTEDENMAPAKKQKLNTSTSEDSNKSSSKTSDTNPSPAKAITIEKPRQGTIEKPAKKQTKKSKNAKVADTTLGRLLDETIEDDSSSDDDFVPENALESSDESGSLSEVSDAEDAIKTDNPKLKALPNRKQISLKTLVGDTIEDEDSSDDDFEPENENDSIASLDSSSENDVEDDDDDEEEEEDDETSDDEENSDGNESSDDEEESSPTKSGSNFRKETQNKLDKIGQKKPVGGIRKKNKVQKPIKSQALKQKIQESVKEMAKQTKVVQIKPKILKKGKKKVGL